MLSFCSRRCLERAQERAIVNNLRTSSSAPNCLTRLPFPSFYQRLFCKAIRMKGDGSGPWGHPGKTQVRSQNQSPSFLSPCPPIPTSTPEVSGRRRVTFLRAKFLHCFGAGGFPFHPGGDSARLGPGLWSQAGEQEGREQSPCPGIQQPYSSRDMSRSQLF